MEKIIFSGILIRIIGLILSLGTSVIIARTLGTERFGQYAFLVTVVELLTIIALFGSPALIMREVAAGVSTKAFGMVRGVLNWTTRATTLLSIPIMLIAVIMFLKWNAYVVHPLSLKVFLAAASLVLIDALSRQNTNAIQGLGQIISSQILGILVCSIFILVFLVGTITMFPESVSIANIFLILVICRILTLLLLHFKKNQYLPNEVYRSEPEYYPSKWLKSALPLLLVSSMLIINTRIDIIMLGYLQESMDVGLYRVAQRGGQLMLFGVMAVDSVINPMAARAWAQKQKKQLQKVVSKSIWIALLFTIPLFAIYLLLGQDLITFIYGFEYKEAWLPLVVLSSGYLSLAFLGRGGVILTMSHFERHTAAAISIGAVCNIIFNLLLIPRYGINGAATATALAVSLRMIMESLFAYRKTGINTTIFSLIKLKSRT